MPRRTPLALLAVTLVAFALPGDVGAQSRDDQAHLGPGLYVLQTRTVSATCEDDERTGYVHTFLAPIHGVPGDREMRMHVMNSRHWPRWDLEVTASGMITGDAVYEGRENPSPATPRSHFEVRRDGPRYTGRGARTYRAGDRECRVTYDALLRRIDL